MADTPAPPPPPPPPPSVPPPPPGGSGVVGSQQFSGWGNRVLAAIVRGLVPGIPILLLFLIGSVLGDLGLILVLAGYVFGIAAAIRMFIQRGHLGYDVGDAAAGQVLIEEATNRPLGSGGKVFVRNLAHILDSLPCYIGYLWPIWDSKNQTFADKIMSTVVVSDRPQQHSAGDLISNAFQFWTPVTKT